MLFLELKQWAYIDISSHINSFAEHLAHPSVGSDNIHSLMYVHYISQEQLLQQKHEICYQLQQIARLSKMLTFLGFTSCQLEFDSLLNYRLLT